LVDRDGALYQEPRQVEFGLLILQESESVEGIEIVWLVNQNCIVEAFGLRKTALLVGDSRLLELS